MLGCLADKDLNYDDLASGLKASLQKDKSAFDADRLQNYTGNSVWTLHFLYAN
ncbi:hypothetical protein TSUD_370590 [Trifolium subterraneum]|uniref:Uncharacterized protein n=1 Tax=Trifolium subterraneum TaxID=3900 RepID=A0A2Z6N5J7_TRISU|nr:hypothetical protein TSUD_370590 [Trifolium subterraneum]